MIIILTVIWILSIISFFFAVPYTGYLFSNSHLPSFLGATNIFVIIGIPILSMMLFAARLMFKTRIRKSFSIGMWSFWVLNVVSFFGLATYLVSQFNQQNTIENTISLREVTGDTLRINMQEGHNNDVIFQMGSLQIQEEGLTSEHIDIDIVKGKSDQFVLTQFNKARGVTRKQAKELANLIQYPISVSDNVISVPGLFQISKENQWRNQHVELRLEVPEGKTVIYDKGVRGKIHHVKIDREREYPLPSHNYYWKMEESGLVCHDFIKQNNKSEDLPYDNFSQLNIEGLMKVQVKRGKKYNLRITGRDEYTRKIEVSQSDKTLHITSDLKRTSSPVRVYITMPHLKSINTENTDDVKIDGFKESHMLIKHEGRYDIKAFVDVDSIQIKQIGRNEIDLRGSGKYMKATIHNRSRLDAEHFAVNDAIVNATNRSVAKITAVKSITGQKSRGSKVISEGDPTVFEVSDLQ